MSEADVVRRAIVRLVADADDEQTRIIHEVACSAGYLWRCGSTTCLTYNHRGQRYCQGCGWGHAGKPVGDITPSPYGAPKWMWTALRRTVRAHFARLGKQMPDAVLFDYWGGPGWRGAEVTAMYGGRAEDNPGGFRDRAEHKDIAAALDALTRFDEPGYGEHIRLVLSSS